MPPHRLPEGRKTFLFDHTPHLGYDIGLGAHEKFLPMITLYWRALKPLDKNYTLWPFFINRQGQIIEEPTERPVGRIAD